MEINKIAFTEFIDNVEANYESTKILHWYGKDIEVKRHLELSEMIAFVSDVISACYVSPDDIGDIVSDTESAVFAPELKRYAIDYMTIAYYTNIDLNGDISPYNFITHSDIVDRIRKSIDSEQYEDMMMSIDVKIEFINNSNIFKMTKDFNSINEAMDSMVPALNAIIESFDPKEMKGIIESLSKIQEENTLKEIALKEMKSVDKNIIEFEKKRLGD